MKLLCTPQSPFARKVRAAAIELGLDNAIEPVHTEVVPGRPNTDYAELYNPLRKIPALVLEDGATLFDSTVICEYLDARAGGGRLIPETGAARWRVLTQHALAQGLCEAALLIRYETWLRPERLRWPTWIDDHWGRITSGLDRFEAHPQALDGPVNLAHLALGSLLGYLELRFPEYDWRTARPELGRWFIGLSARRSFVDTDPTGVPFSRGRKGEAGHALDHPEGRRATDATAPEDGRAPALGRAERSAEGAAGEGRRSERADGSRRG